MKFGKKLFSLLLAAIMVMSMVGTAMAATVTLPGDNTILQGHEFTAFQIFSGVYKNNVLSNVNWGTGIKDNEFLSALKSATDECFMVADTSEGADENAKKNVFASCSSAADVATVLGANNSNTALAKAVAELAYKNKSGEGQKLSSGNNDLANGYYLIVDTTENVGEGGVYNAALLDVAGDVTVQVKTDAPEVQKKVKDTNDSEANSTTGWQDSADYDIGDEVPFQLKATLPDNVHAYDKYQIEFTDTLSAGLKYDSAKAGLKVYVGTNNQDKPIAESLYTSTVKVNSDGTTTLTIAIDDVKKEGIAAGDNAEIYVEYDAVLDDDAVIGAAGNPNDVYLTFSNNPNDGGEGTNHTPKDIVIVFTFKTVINKVQKNAEYDSTNPDSKEYIPLTGAGFTLEKRNPLTEGQEENNPEAWTWKMIKTYKNEDGNQVQFEFNGLDDGVYRLTESKTPDGFNTIEPIIFKVVATHSVEAKTPVLETLTGEKISGVIDLTGEHKENGTFTANVVNNSGAELPETGGMGTTILYVVGGLLVVAAAVLLMTKKRVGADK